MMNSHSELSVLFTPRSFSDDDQGVLSTLAAPGIEIRRKQKGAIWSADELAAELTGVDVLVLGLEPLTRRVLEAADSLKLVVRFGSGMDNVDGVATAERGIVVVNTPNANSDAVAELTIGLMIALARNVISMRHGISCGQFKKATGTEIAGKALGIIGFGNIGKAVARKARALGVTVLAHDPFVASQGLGQVGETRLVGLGELLQTSDFVSIHAPLTPDTKDFIGHQQFQQMKVGVYLLNMARHGLVQGDALYEALRAGRIAGAALDTIDSPNELDPRLLEFDNVILTPHAGASSRESVERMKQAAVDEVKRFADGLPPRNPWRLI